MRTFANFFSSFSWRLNPPQVLSLGFVAVIMIGTCLLMLPLSTVTGQSMDFLDALFMATSSVCLTGLAVVDTGTFFSFFGKLVIISLVQVGAVGVMTMATLVAVIMRRRIQLRDRLVMQEAMNQLSFSGIVRLTLYVFQVTLLIEFVGGTLLALCFFPDFGLRALYYGYWHAVSAFCNAGFDILGESGYNFNMYADHFAINMILSVLIITGGLGFTVLADWWQNRSFAKCTLHSKVVLSTTGILIVAGMFGILLLEYGSADALGDLPWHGKLLAGYFLSVTVRTAGFSTIVATDLTDATLLLLILLMFIGASPGSTGSGIKTTTWATICAAVWSLVRGDNEVKLFYRRISSAMVYKAFAVCFISAIMVIVMTMLLSISENKSFIHILFEVVAAFSTTGLSVGVTGELSDWGKVLMMCTMFIGRIGPITFVMALTLKSKKRIIQYPEGKITIG